MSGWRLWFQPPVPPLVTVRAPEGYAFEGSRPVVHTPLGLMDGNEIDGPYPPAIYLGELHWLRPKRTPMAIPAPVATWQSSEDAEPDQLL